MRMRQAPFALAAIGAHVALASWIPERVPPPSVRRAEPMDELTFVLEPSPPEPAAIPVSARPLSMPAEPRHAALRASIPSPRLDEPAPPVEPEVDDAPRPSAPAPMISLDPAGAASAWVAVSPDARDEAPAPASARSSEDELERSLDADLRSRAMTKAYLSRTEIDLQARPDGSYVHRGHGFTAIIAPDGSVTFRDRAGLAFEPPSISIDEEGLHVDGVTVMQIDASGRMRRLGEVPVLPELLTQPGGRLATETAPEIVISLGSFEFDLQGELMRAAGQDPWEAARLRFLEETEELRAELTDRHAAAARERDARRLRVQLRRIARDRARPPIDRRRAIFDLWDGCAEDEIGAEARAIIVGFAAEQWPAGSRDAFTEDELRAWNATRDSGDAFEPYRRDR